MIWTIVRGIFTILNQTPIFALEKILFIFLEGRTDLSYVEALDSKTLFLYQLK